MTKKILAISIVSSLVTALCPGEPQEDIDQRIREGQDAIYRLEYAMAAGIFQQLIQQAPDNPVGYGMLAIVHWNDLLFRAGNLALDDYATPTPFSREVAGKLGQPQVREAQELFHRSNRQLLEVCEKSLAKDPNSTLALYFKGLHFENLAAEAVAITKKSRQAISYGTTAKNLHQRVLVLDPDFTDAFVSVASYEYASATLNWSIKWLAFLLGYRGDKQNALQKMEVVAAKGKYRQLDAQVLLALLHSWKGDPRKGEPQEAVEIFRNLHSRYPQNYLLDINMAAILEQKLDNPQGALEVYKNLQNNKSSKAWTKCPGEIHYRIGKLYRRLKESSLALASFQQALQATKVEPETEPLTYYHMAQIYEDQGDRQQALDCYRRVLQYQGTDLETEQRIARNRAR